MCQVHLPLHQLFKTSVHPGQGFCCVCTLSSGISLPHVHTCSYTNTHLRATQLPLAGRGSSTFQFSPLAFLSDLRQLVSPCHFSYHHHSSTLKSLFVLSMATQMNYIYINGIQYIQLWFQPLPPMHNVSDVLLNKQWVFFTDTLLEESLQ